MSSNVMTTFLKTDPSLALRLQHQALAFTSCGVTLADAQDPEMPLIYVNQAFSEITGFSQDEILGKNCRMLQGEQRDQEGIVEIRRALAEARSCKVLLRNFKKDGTPFWNELILSPIFEGSGQVSHFVGVQTDVTAREEARLDLRKLCDELATTRQDAERFADLVSMRLREPLDNLEATVQAIFEQHPKLDKAQTEQLKGLAGQALELSGLIGGWLEDAKARHAGPER